MALVNFAHVLGSGPHILLSSRFSISKLEQLPSSSGKDSDNWSPLNSLQEKVHCVLST